MAATRWQAIFPYGRALIILALLDGALIIAAARAPHFPGDLALAHFIQSAAPMPVAVARWITATADKPGCFVLLALTFLIAWVINGWRAALVSVVLFFGLWFLGIWLSPIAAQPRPSPELIQVIGQPKGYAFPSIFGLIYVATFGYVGILGAMQCRGALRWIIAVAAIVILIVGAIARIDLGAHWPSDLWVAYLIGLFWILLLLPVVMRHLMTGD